MWHRMGYWAVDAVATATTYFLYQLQLLLLLLRHKCSILFKIYLSSQLCVPYFSFGLVQFACRLHHHVFFAPYSRRSQFQLFIDLLSIKYTDCYYCCVVVAACFFCVHPFHAGLLLMYALRVYFFSSFFGFSKLTNLFP